MLIETDDYIDAVTAARILGITRARVSTLCKEGRFPGMVRVGHFWLIPREAVEKHQRLKPGELKSVRPDREKITRPERKQDALTTEQIKIMIDEAVARALSEKERKEGVKENDE